MHRLLSNTCGKVSNCFPISQIYLKQNSNQACFFCRQRHAQLLVSVKTNDCSSFSTFANSDILILNGVKKVKKNRKSKQKYTELFEVGDNISNLKKVVIKNLDASHIDVLTQIPEIAAGKDSIFEVSEYFSESLLNCSQCDFDKDVTDTKHEEFSYNNVGTIKHEDLLESSGELAHDNDILDDLDQKDKSMLYLLSAGAPSSENQSSNKNSAQKNKKSSKSNKPAKESKDSKVTSSSKEKLQDPLNVKLEMMKKMEKENNFNDSLLSFIEISVSCQFLNRAFHTVSKYHQSYKHAVKKNPNTQFVPVSNPKIFSTLAHGFASKHNLRKIKELIHIFTEVNISPTPQLFSACFECIGRMPRTPKLDVELEELYKWLKREGLSLNQLFTETKYVNDQQQKVLEAVQRLKPNFEIKLLTPDTNYSCQLLNHFNNGEKNFRSPAENLLTPKSLKKLALEQLKIESKVTVAIESVENVDETPEVFQFREKLKLLKATWMEDIRNGLTREISLIELKNYKFRSNFYINLYPYLRVLDVESYAELIMQEIEKLMEGSETYSLSLNVLFREIGNQVRKRYLIKHKKQTSILKKQFSLYKAYCNWYLNPDSSSWNTRMKWQQLLHESSRSGPDIRIPECYWSNLILHGIGRVLYNVITKDIKIDVNILKDSTKTPQMEPAFFVLFRTHGIRATQEIKPHPVLSRLIKASCPKDLKFDATLVPMLSPPIPWSSINSGGYILAKADLIRLPQFSSRQWHRLEQTPSQQIYPPLDSLNQLASVPWIINKPILDVIVHIFNSGGSHKLDIPMPPSACPAPDPIPSNATKEERFLAVKQRFMLARQRSEMHSLRCDALYRLSLANHYRDKIFWLPHNMDFRGRVYPVAPHLNHLGSDMARSMLLFAKGEPLGPKGLDWLKIHCINLTGLKKRDTIKNRLDYANEILPDIIDSANKPLNGKQWWAESETPWQTLACCMVIRDAINSGDPESFICHFPVHQDGSCNGLQHYAALGRDLAGAISVNLTPAEGPQDVYSCVAALVEKEREKDAERGLETAIILKDFIKRKVIKQTVMTTVYGVTRFGARLQIAKQLKDIDQFPSESVWQASNYLVGKTFYCLQEMFTSTKQIQDWFTDCARLISKAGQPIEWITPLGLPIIQPYMRSPSKSETSHSTSPKLQPHFGVDHYERPNVMRQKNAFPPNFIHSLDSCHMMLTSLHCEREHITFVSVHDCFWTHPNTVEIMNKVCREQFVNLHSLPILEDLSEYLVSRFGYDNVDNLNENGSKRAVKRLFNLTLKNVPPKGELDIRQVKESVYFFS